MRVVHFKFNSGMKTVVRWEDVTNISMSDDGVTKNATLKYTLWGNRLQMRARGSMAEVHARAVPAYPRDDSCEASG